MSIHELESKIIKWLDEQGYPLEMQIARILKQVGFSVSMGDIYDDFETGTSREIDVTAAKWITGDLWNIQICFRIECKLSRDKPWVVFTAKKMPEYSVGSLICSNFYREFLFETLADPLWKQKLFERQLFRKIYIGHGITRALSEGVDVPYKAVMSAVKSALAKELEIDNIPKGRMEGSQYVIVIPVVVFDGELFEVKLDDNGEMDITHVSQSVINWKMTPTRESLVSIVTLEGFDEFANEMVKLVNTFESITHSNSAYLDELIVDHEIGY